jgi:hypothetical protein
MVRGWAEEHGIRTLSYINPFFSEYIDPNAPIPNATARALIPPALHAPPGPPTQVESADDGGCQRVTRCP